MAQAMKVTPTATATTMHTGTSCTATTMTMAMTTMTMTIFTIMTIPTNMSIDNTAVMQLLQFTDSAFPVGTFSFSNGLETAAYEKIVTDKSTLHDFARSQAWQAAFTDGIAALYAHRAFLNEDIEEILRSDRELMLSKMNEEARIMLTRMGKKLAELGVRLYPEDTAIKTWLDKINAGETPGMYPVAQGMMFAKAGLTEKELFYSHQYGVINMVLSAALRCVRVSHYDTQELLFDLSGETETLYERVKDMRLDEMNAFFPELDILASLHEKGTQRMFMS